MARTHVPSGLTVIVYFMAAATFIVEIALGLKSLYDLEAMAAGRVVEGAGFGTLASLIVWFCIAGFQWSTMCGLASIHLIWTRKQRSVTIGVLAMGLLVGFVFAISPVLLLPKEMPADLFNILTTLGWDFSPVIFIFGFASGSGFAALVIFTFGLLSKIGRRVVRI